MNRGKVLILDPQNRRGQQVARRLRAEGFDPALFSDARIAIAYAYRTRDELTAAVVESDEGRERHCVSGLRLLRPDLPIFAGIGLADELGHASGEPESSQAACLA